MSCCQLNITNYKILNNLKDSHGEDKKLSSHLGISAPTPSAPLSQTKLLTAGGSPQLGARSIPLRFGSCHFSWSFQLSPVSVPILSSDFLRHHVARASVLDADSPDVLSAISSPAASDPFCAHLQQAPREIRKLLSEYPAILPSASTPKHGVFHDLPIAHSPWSSSFAKACRLNPWKLATAKAEFLKIEKAGIFLRSSSPCSGPTLPSCCFSS